MRFWDTSAIVPLLVTEPATAAMLTCIREDREMAAWWGTSVECASALARLEREGAGTAVVRDAFKRLDTFASSWVEVEPHDEVREVARRLLRVHSLRAAGAVQLAAATLVADRRPSSLTVVTLDDRLRTAAAREGFLLIDV